MLKVAATAAATSAQPIKYKMLKAAGSDDDDVGVAAFINFFVYVFVYVCALRGFFSVSFFFFAFLAMTPTSTLATPTSLPFRKLLLF